VLEHLVEHLKTNLAELQTIFLLVNSSYKEYISNYSLLGH